jgi:type II secretion system protein G
MEAKKKRMGEIIKEIKAMEKQVTQKPESRNDPKMREKVENLMKEGDTVMKELTGGDRSKEDELGIEIVKKYAPEYYEEMQASLKQSQMVRAQSQLYNIKTALEQYHMDKGAYPTTEEGLRVLIKEDDPRRPPLLGGGEKALKDPWGNPIIYKLSESPQFILKSAGPDGKEETTDDIEVK